MPRVTINKKKYKVKDISTWIAGKMFEKKLRQEDLSKLLGISQPAFSNRMKKGLFSYSDLLELLKELDATDEEFFLLIQLSCVVSVSCARRISAAIPPLTFKQAHSFPLCCAPRRGHGQASGKEE